MQQSLQVCMHRAIKVVVSYYITGGAVAMYEKSAMRGDNALLLKNRALYGGAIFAQYACHAKLLNSLVEDNTGMSYV
jgi:predicted outer membrane repeat protein